MPSQRGRRGGLEEGGLELQPVGAVVDPGAAGLDELAGADRGRGADHGHELPLAADLDPQHAEAGLGVVEGDPLDQAGQGLASRAPRRPASWWVAMVTSDGSLGRHPVAREHLQPAHALLGDAVQPPPRGLEPAIDVAVEDARGVRRLGLLAQQRHRQGPAALAVQERRAAQGLLPVGGQERLAAGRAAPVRVAAAPGVLAQQQGGPRLVLARQALPGRRTGVADHLHPFQPRPSAPDGRRAGRGRGAGTADVRPGGWASAARGARSLGERARRGRRRQVDQVGDREPVDALQHEAEREGQLELDHDRRLGLAVGAAPPDGDHVAAAHLALHLVAEVLEEALDRLVQVLLPVERARRRKECGGMDERRRSGDGHGSCAGPDHGDARVWRWHANDLLAPLQASAAADPASQGAISFMASLVADAAAASPPEGSGRSSRYSMTC